MKFLRLIPIAISALLLGSCGGSKSADSDSSHLIILHTNDTHSQIDPDRHDKGGIARRKVLVDSVRAEHQNVMLIDAGDAVQGSLYYTLFGGEVERLMMNGMGYDIRLLGNHEFDKGLDVLAREWRQIDGIRLSTNYDFSETPLDGLFVPSVMKEFDGRKIGFIGINLDPEGIIAEHNYEGLDYDDAIEAANREAAELRRQGADMVIAVTHIGYSNEKDYDDLTLAARTSDIDVIIGGHSHTLVTPSDAPDAPKWTIKNRDGNEVTVVQTGATGTYLGEIDIDLRNRSVTPRMLTVDSRLDSRVDSAYAALIVPYRAKVDSVRGIVIGNAPVEMLKRSNEQLNFFSDFVMRRGQELMGGRQPDLAIMNKGGLRTDLASGTITNGSIIDIAPFDNYVVVMEIEGDDLLDTFRILASQEGQGVSSNVRALFDPSTHELNSVTISGKPIDPERKYLLATIDYLADGNDYMTPLKEGKIKARSKQVLFEDMIENIRAGRLNSALATPDPTPRMTSM